MSETCPDRTLSCHIMVVCSNGDLAQAMAAKLAEVGFATDLKTSTDQALEAFHNGYRPNGVLLDLHMENGKGLELYRWMAQDGHPWRCWLMVLLCCPEDQQRLPQWHYGPISHLVKPFPLEDLVVNQRHLCRLSQGDFGLGRCTPSHLQHLLTARETQVLQAIASGQNNAEIAQSLQISLETVKSHMKVVLQKLQARDRTQAVVLALAAGLIELPPVPL
jgi:DNA-binding NarL/FixJ family response regulator